MAQHRGHKQLTIKDGSQPDYDIRSKEDLLRLLKQYQPRGGLPVKTLRESWPNVVPAIEDLERQGKVLVTRAGTTEEKEGVLKMVFYDEIQKPEKVDRGSLCLLFACVQGCC